METNAIAKTLSLSTQTVDKWRRRFSLCGVGTLSNAPRSGTPRTHGVAEIAKLRNHDQSTGFINPRHGSRSLRVSLDGGEDVANLWPETSYG